MTIITISREYGSEGDSVAESVAKALGYHLVDKDFISAVLAEYGLVEFDQEYDSLPGFWEKFIAQRSETRDLMGDMLNRVERAVARHGNVVMVGRSGFAALAGFADVLNVRLQAPREVRIARTKERKHLSLDEATAAVDESDKVRATFVEEFYGMPWGSIKAFDLVINTDAIPVEAATNWIIEAAKACATRELEGLPMTRSIEVDPVLAEAVSNRLGCHTLHD